MRRLRVDVSFAASLLARNVLKCFGFSLVMGFAVVVVGSFLNDAYTEYTSFQDGLSLRRNNAVAFNSFYPEGETARRDQGMLDEITKIIADERRYALVVNNSGVESNSIPEGHLAPILIIGQAFERVFPQSPVCSPAPCAVVGRASPDYGAVHVSLHGVHIPIRDTIPEGVSLLDPNAVGMPLDARTLIYLRTSDVHSLDALEVEELSTRMVLLNPDEAEVEDYVRQASKQGLYLIPQRLSGEVAARFQDVMTRFMIAVLACGAFLAAVLASTLGMLRAVISSEWKEFTVRRMAGARDIDLLLSLGLFIAVPMLVVPLLFLIPMYLTGGLWSHVVAWAGLTLVLCVGGVVVSSWQMLQRADWARGLSS